MANKDKALDYSSLDKWELLEHICDEFDNAIKSDLEHGVKSLNEIYATKFFKEYPELNKFAGYLNQLREIYGLDE